MFQFFFELKIDDERRIELNRDRELAIAIESRLKLKNHQNREESQTDFGTDNEETLVKVGTENASNYDTSAAVDSLLDDNLSTQKIVEVDKIEEAFENMSEIEDDDTLTTKSKPPETVLKLDIDTNLNTFKSDILSPSFSLQSSPSLGALDDSANQSLYFTPMSGRGSYTPSKGDRTPVPRLIRSNSYVIEKPSALLVQHLEASGIFIGTPLKSPMSLNEFRNRSKSNTPRKPSGDSIQIKEQKFVSKTPRPLFLNNTTNSMIPPLNRSVKTNSPYATKSTKAQNLKQISGGIFKHRESPNRRDSSIYEPKSTKAKESAKKVNGSVSCMESNRLSSNSRPSVGTESSNGNISVTNYQDIFAMIEQKHEAQMKALVKHHQDEQKRMQAEFSRQQDELLKKISGLIKYKEEKTETPNQTQNGTNIQQNLSENSKKSNEKMLIEEVNSAVAATTDANGNRINRFTPGGSKCIRRLSYDDNKVIRDDKSYSSSLSTISSESYDIYPNEEMKAATIITAYARGYLTRKLLKTTKVQTIIKTIRDTLRFVLDLHYEYNQNESMADIKLKANLLQQVILTQ